MNGKPRITNRTFVLTAVIGSLLIMASLMAFTFWSSRQTSNATNEAVSAVSSFYLEAMADRRAKLIINQINNNFDQMEKAVAYIKEENIQSIEELRAVIGKMKSLLSLNRFALVDEDNVVYTQYTTYTGGSRHEFLEKETMPDRVISTVSIYGSSRQLCLASSISDLRIQGKPFKACFVQIDISDIADLLAFDDQGRTYFGLYSANGANLSGTELGPVISDQNFLQAIKYLVPQDVWEEHCDHFARGEVGNITFFSGDQEETLYYVPIPGTGWEVAVLIREKVIQDQIRDISEKTLATGRNMILFSLVSVLVLASILLLEYHQLSKERLEEEKEHSRAYQNMANTDPLTGIRNKHAYMETEASLNEQIARGEIDKLGVVVCDINGLKQVNDTQGHAAGDQLIKDACMMICEYFMHGAVFRIGGDEFVVLLQGKGYDTMDEVLAALNRKAEENIPRNEVVVATGSAVLEPGDQNLHVMFERADQTMYERKKELKRLGAKSRDQ